MEKSEQFLQLEQWVSNIRDELNKLQENVTLSESEKRSEADKIGDKIDAQKAEIQKRIDELGSKTDNDSILEKEKTQELLNTLDSLANLKLSIINSPSTTITLTNPVNVEWEKWFFWKAWDWIWTQWWDVWDKEKWQTEWWVNLLRTVWFVATWVWAVALIAKWVKKLFWKDKKKEDDEEDDEDEEEQEEWWKKSKKKKKSFWKRPFWKFIKGTAITWWIVWWVYAIWKFFGWWWKEWATWRDRDKDKFWSYENEIVNNPDNKEKFENYEALWDKVDTVYESIFDRELKSWYEDEQTMNRIAEEQSKREKHYKWIVPYCLDNQFKSVEWILWQNSSFLTALHWWVDAMIWFIKNAWTWFLKIFAESYLEFLPSRAPFKGLAWSLSERVDRWRIENKQVEQEMQYFFRQSIRVQTYLFEKKDQLVDKLVKEAAQTYWKSEKEIKEDEELFKKYIETNSQYQAFINQPTYNAVHVLNQNNLFDWNIGNELKDHVAEIDKERDKILWSKSWEKDILEVINDKKNSNQELSEDDNKKLWNACNWILKSVDEDILPAVEESAWNIYWDLFRCGDANLREYLNKSWLDKVFESYKQIMLQKKSELAEWKLSNDKKIELAETVNAMLALKKEVQLWKFTIERDYDEYWNLIYRIPWFLCWSVKNLYKWVTKLIGGEWWAWLAYIWSAWLWTGVIITAAWVVRWLTAWKRWLAKAGAVITTLPVSVPTMIIHKWVKYIKPIRIAEAKLKYPFKYSWKEGAEKLLRNLSDGFISLEDAWSVVERHTVWWIVDKDVEKVWKDAFRVNDVSKGDDFKKIVFDSFVRKYSWWMDGYLQSLKSDDALYKSLMENFDASKDIRRAIANQTNPNGLRRIVDNVVVVPEAVRMSRHYRALMNDLDIAERSVLEAISAGWDEVKLSTEVDNLIEFRKVLWNMTPKELEQSAELLAAFKWEKGTIWNAIEQLTLLKKLKWKAVVGENLDEILKTMDFRKLRKLKWWKISWVTDEAIEWLAKAFETIKKSKIQKLFDNIWSAIRRAIKTFIKYLSKAT